MRGYFVTKHIIFFLNEITVANDTKGYYRCNTI